MSRRPHTRLRYASPTTRTGDGIWLESPKDGKSGRAVHVAFRAKTADAIKAFHEAGLAAGGTDNGKPGPRPNYGPGYYAAFVHDPDGNNIEPCSTTIRRDPTVPAGIMPGQWWLTGSGARGR